MLTRATAMCVLAGAAFAPAAFGSTLVVLLRHAEIGVSGDNDPPLSEAGRKRAQRIADMLADGGIGAIYVTQYRRTQQTAEPLARRLGIEPRMIPATDPARLVSAVRADSARAVLVVGHSNTVPDIVHRLGGPEVEIAAEDFEQVYVVAIPSREATLLRLHTSRAATATTFRNSPAGAMLSRRSSVMQMKFVRSGGFAGRATNVEGTLTFDASGAKVTSQGGNYERDVPAEEAQPLRAAADPTRLKAAVRAAKPGPERDAYQYEVTVTGADGAKQTIRLMQGAGPDMQTLSNWVQQESDRIWQHRLHNH